MALSEKYNARHWVIKRNKDPGPLLDVQLPERPSGKRFSRETGTTNEKISTGGTFLHVFQRQKDGMDKAGLQTIHVLLGMV